MKKRLKNKNINKFDFFHQISRGLFSCPYRHNSQFKTKDNQDYRIGGGIGDKHGNVIRVPSLKRSIRVWKKFYRLFPLVYMEMREHVQNEKEGDVIEIDVFYGEPRKVRVVEMDMMVADSRFRNTCRSPWLIYQDEIDRGLETGRIKIKKK